MLLLSLLLLLPSLIRISYTHTTSAKGGIILPQCWYFICTPCSDVNNTVCFYYHYFYEYFYYLRLSEQPTKPLLVLKEVSYSRSSTISDCTHLSGLNNTVCFYYHYDYDYYCYLRLSEQPTRTLLMLKEVSNFRSAKRGTIRYILT